MLTDYIAAAMATATFEPLEDQPEIYGEVPGCPGVWATGITEAHCRAELQSVLEEWIVLKLSFGHELPTVCGLSIVRPAAA